MRLLFSLFGCWCCTTISKMSVHMAVATLVFCWSFPASLQAAGRPTLEQAEFKLTNGSSKNWTLSKEEEYLKLSGVTRESPRAPCKESFLFKNSPHRVEHTKSGDSESDENSKNWSLRAINKFDLEITIGEDKYILVFRNHGESEEAVLRTRSRKILEPTRDLILRPDPCN